MFPVPEVVEKVVVHVKPESLKDHLLDKKGERHARAYRRTQQSEIIRDALEQLEEVRQLEKGGA